MENGKLLLKQLSTKDGSDVYKMLQRIKSNENEFKNPVYGLSFGQYKEWLVEQDNWSKGLMLPLGYVPQTIYWLYKGTVPVGIGKIRHALNDNSRLIGGNIGYAVDPEYRGQGYATVLLRLLLIKAKELGLEEILLTVEKNNPASKCVIENNNGKVFKENAERWYFHFK